MRYIVITGVFSDDDINDKDDDDINDKENKDDKNNDENNVDLY